jgi:hypothetical protein
MHDGLYTARVSSNPVIIKTGNPGTHRSFEAKPGREIEIFHGIALIINQSIDGIPVRGKKEYIAGCPAPGFTGVCFWPGPRVLFSVKIS